MGSKRSTKNSSKNRSLPLLADPPVDGNDQNLKNSSLGTPSKSRKKPKLSAPISTNSTFLSPTPSTDGEADSQNSNRKGKTTEVSNEISPSDGAASRSSQLRWGEDDTLKLLKTVIALQAKSGFLPTSANIIVLLKEIKDWTPIQLSEKNLNSKLRHLRFKFNKNPKPGPESSDFDRSFHELASKVWGPESGNAKDNATGSAKEHGRMEKKENATGKSEKVSKKPKGKKKKVDDGKEDEGMVEEDERDSEHGEGTDEKAGKNVVLENGEEEEKDELLVDGDHGLLDAKGDEHSYKYLRLALEEYWTESKLNLDTLYAAFPKVNPLEAKRLDESFREVFVGMLKLKMEKNKVSNEIIRASLGF